MLARLLVAVSLCVLGPAAAPAVAENPPTTEITHVDASSPGSVALSVSTSREQTWVQLVTENGGGLGLPSVLSGSGTHELVLPTWGLDPAGSYGVRASACEHPLSESCESVTAAFAPTETGATYTFSDDRVLTGTEEATVTVDGPLGGGRLQARFYDEGGAQTLTTGTQALRLTRSGVAWVHRCSILGCVRLSPTATYQLDKGDPVSPAGREPVSQVDPDGTAATDAWIDLHVGGRGQASFDGGIVDAYGAPVPGTALADTLMVAADGVARIHLDMDPVPAHTTVRLAVRVVRGAGDAATSRWVAANLPTVVRQPPSVIDGTANRSVFHPARDGYQDLLRIRADVSDSVSTHLEAVHGPTGAVVAIPGPAAAEGRLTWAWDGTDPDGRRVDPGHYLLRVVATDAWGLTTVQDIGDVRLDWRSLTPVRRAYTVPAAGTMVRRVGGRCARVRVGAEGWPRGLALSAGRCQDGASAESSHEVRRVPPGWVRGRLSLATYSRATDGHDNVEGPFTMLQDSDGRTVQRTGLGRLPGWDRSRSFDSDRLLGDRGHLRWHVYAGFDSRQDVRSFRLTYDGVALR